MLGCKALDYAETVAWGHCTHGGFRPFNALGVATARKAWKDAHQNARRKWCRGNFHHATILFPLDGLGTKVLGDRIAELLELNQMMTPETFVSRFFPVPVVPRVGGTAKMISCLHHRSMILGSDLAPVKQPVQYVHAIERKLTALPQSCTSRSRDRGSFELAGGRERLMLLFESLGAQPRCWITCHILNQ